MFQSIQSRILTGWIIITIVGLSSFVLSKRSIEAHRYEGMKVRQRMRDSNIGEYEVVRNFPKN